MKAASPAPKPDPSLLDDLLEVGLEMQSRFAAEPVYAKTGKGYLKSAGVEELKQIKVAQQATRTRI